MLPAHAAPVPAAAIDQQLVRSTCSYRIDICCPCPYSAANKLRVLLLTIKGTDKQTDNHTHTHLFNGSFSGSTRVSRYQKRKTNPDFTEARGSEWQWHQLGHMQVCISHQSDNMPAPHHWTDNHPTNI